MSFGRIFPGVATALSLLLTPAVPRLETNPQETRKEKL